MKHIAKELKRLQNQKDFHQSQLAHHQGALQGIESELLRYSLAMQAINNRERETVDPEVKKRVRRASAIAMVDAMLKKIEDGEVI